MREPKKFIPRYTKLDLDPQPWSLIVVSIVSIDAHLLLISTEVYTASGNKPQMKAIVRTKPNLALVPCKLKTHLLHVTKFIEGPRELNERVFVAAPIPCTKALVRSLVAWTHVPVKSIGNASHPWFVTFHMACICIKSSLPERETQTLHHLGMSHFHQHQDTATPFSVSTDVPTISESLDGWWFHGWRYATWWESTGTSL